MYWLALLVDLCLTVFFVVYSVLLGMRGEYLAAVVFYTIAACVYLRLPVSKLG